MSKISIDEIYPKGEAYPMIVTFQNGDPTENFSAQNCKLLTNKETGTERLLLEVDNMIYHGDVEKEELGSTFILARNRITGKTRIIEVGAVEVKPFIFEETDNTVVDSTTLGLSRKFGSKKNKRQMEQREKLKVNLNTVTEQMKNVTENVSEDHLDLSAYTIQSSEDFYIPPIDRNASEVADVYCIDKMLSPEQYDKIYSEIESKDMSTEIHSLIKPIIADRDLSPREAVLALYASALFYLYSVMSREISKKSFYVTAFSSTLNEIVLNNFCQNANNKRARPTMYRDKALCHGIVIVLILSGFKIELETLASNLKLTPTLTATKARATGASIVTSGSKKYVQLKLPLPAVKMARRKSAKF